MESRPLKNQSEYTKYLPYNNKLHDQCGQNFNKIIFKNICVAASFYFQLIFVFN